MKPAILNGYPFVTLSNKVRVQKYVHQLVLMAFVGPAPDKHECAHIDGDRKNAKLKNLRWATCLENNRDKILHGTSLKGSKNPSAKLTDDDVSKIKFFTKRKLFKRTQLADLFKVSYSTIKSIQLGKSWI
jgi:hypothetical protein